MKVWFEVYYFHVRIKRVLLNIFRITDILKLVDMALPYSTLVKNEMHHGKLAPALKASLK
ncbi:MAG: hypothetical protein BMS9Abin25_1588 [Gammaproteobacteria bacterium]|nr:MAG: hypothetical protein BMS9Abin25_1588 [Gammaproteobacteria bacterium]